jgi:hypothetical protein
MVTSTSVRSSGTGGRDGDGPARRPAGLEARIADALVTRLVESRFSEALMQQILVALTESRDVEQLVVHLLRQPAVNGTVDELVDRQLGRVLQELRKSEAVRELVREQADAYLQHLAAHPGSVQELVREQVDLYLQHLMAHPETVQQLVRTQVDLYLQHLTENPEAIRQLIQDQSRGMVRDVQATVRARAFVADDAVDAWVGRLLGRS